MPAAARPWWKRLVPGPAPASAGLPATPGAAWVLARGPSASVDYLVAPRLADLGLPMELVDTRLAPPPPDAPLPAGIPLAVLVRYLPPGWESLLQRLRAAGVPVAYLLDDELFDARAVDELPRAYRRRVRREATDRADLLLGRCSELWVATPHLAARHAAHAPVLVAPRPAPRTLDRQEPVWICYHGTASHEAELDWLVPVMAQVLARCPAARFEAFGDHAALRRLRSLPRTAVLHPLPWPEYLHYTASVRRDIGLAPLRAGRFNAGRGPVKFFDHARMGAAGLYADAPAYRDWVRDGVDGLLLPDDPDAWAQAIVALVQDAPRRVALAAAAQSRARAAAGMAGA